MASILKGRIKISPSGLSSVLISHVCVGSPSANSKKNGLESLSDPLAVASNFGKSEKHVHCLSESLPSGRGGLGKKEKASWRSCRGVRERMAAVELEYGVKNCALLTVTLPSVDDRAFEALARYSSYAIDRLNREFKRFFKDEKFARISVWEYQKRGALHCHILLASDCIHAMKNADIANHFANVWYRVLLAIEKKFPCNILLNSMGERWTLEQLKLLVNDKKEAVFVNVQKVRKSVVAYLSMYLADSNHENKDASKQSLRNKFSPIATWFQWDRESSRLMEKYTDEFVLGYAEPDRKREVVSILEKAKKMIADNVNLAKGTEIKEPKNPYNVGLYWLPKSGLKSVSSAKVSAFCIEKLSHIFKQKDSPNDLKQKPIYEEEGSEDKDFYRGIDEFQGKFYSRMDFIEQALDWGDSMAKMLWELFDFSEEICYKLDERKPKKYKQMELDIYVEKTI